MTRAEMANGVEDTVIDDTNLSAKELAAEYEMLALVAAELRKTCEWKFSDDDLDWQTQCGHGTHLRDGGPLENGFKFCAFCGGTLVEPQAETPATEGKG